VTITYGGNNLAFTLDQGKVTLTNPPQYVDIQVSYTTKEYVTGHAQSLMSNRALKDIGEAHLRDLVLTVTEKFHTGETNPAFYFGEHDRFLVLDGVTREQEVLFKGITDRTRYSYIYEVERVYSVDSDTGVTTDYVQGTHYTRAGNLFTWLVNIDKGTPYTVTYRAAPEYFVLYELPQIRHQGSKWLPRKCALRLWQLYPRLAGVESR
jgi:hypothetical protein